MAILCFVSSFRRTSRAIERSPNRLTIAVLWLWLSV